MKKLLIVANWKANKTVAEAKDWLNAFQEHMQQIQIPPEKEIILCPPFTVLPSVAQFIMEHQLPIKLGSQNVSLFPFGAFTGEVTAAHVREFAQYAIIGHTERRMHFHEEYAVLSEKTRRAIDAGLTPIYCVQDAEIPLVDGVTIIAYEPVSAIGSGKPDTPENAGMIASAIKKRMRDSIAVLYGGSVTSENVHTFTAAAEIDGVLVGGSSLDPQAFVRIIQNA
jgi:triosephosphate isomerase (TIM)